MASLGQFLAVTPRSSLCTPSTSLAGQHQKVNVLGSMQALLYDSYTLVHYSHPKHKAQHHTSYQEVN